MNRSNRIMTPTPTSMSALMALTLAACAASEPTAQSAPVEVIVYSTTSDPIQATFVGPASDADAFQISLRDELSGRQSFVEATAFLALAGPDGELQITPIDPDLHLELQATIDRVAIAFDFVGPPLAVDQQLKEDGFSKTPPPFAKPVQCCKKICPDSYPQAGACDYICSDTGCSGGTSGGGGSGGGSGGGGGGGGGGGQPSVCQALCYAPDIGPCFDSIFTDWSPFCVDCKALFCW